MTPTLCVLVSYFLVHLTLSFSEYNIGITVVPICISQNRSCTITNSPQISGTYNNGVFLPVLHVHHRSALGSEPYHHCCLQDAGWRSTHHPELWMTQQREGRATEGFTSRLSALSEKWYLSLLLTMLWLALDLWPHRRARISVLPCARKGREAGTLGKQH